LYIKSQKSSHCTITALINFYFVNSECRYATILIYAVVYFVNIYTIYRIHL